LKISTIILTFNSEQVISATIESVRAISDETFVVDSFSEDSTVAIATRHGVHVIQHAFENYSAQRNWAIENLPITGDWQLHLDSDERLTHELSDEIARLKLSPEGAEDGFFISRLVVFLGRPIRHGGMYPNWHMRLFRQGHGRCEDRLYDQHFQLNGLAGRLRHPMIDDQRATLSEWSRRHIRWADAETLELSLGEQRGRVVPRFTGLPTERKRALRRFYYHFPLLIRPFLFFCYRYFIRGGFLDGKEGLIFFVLQTFWFRFLIDAKICEMRMSSVSPAHNTE
jgi:glycosyltransferase involved in cell wall biosynthesis